MWELNRTEHCVGPFKFSLMGDNTNKILKNLTMRCEYSGSTETTTFVATKGVDSNMVVVVRRNCGKERHWFDDNGFDWARMLSCNTRENLCQKMAHEISRHWLYEATAYELQHLSGAGFQAIQTWSLENRREFNDE